VKYWFGLCPSEVHRSLGELWVGVGWVVFVGGFFWWCCAMSEVTGVLIFFFMVRVTYLFDPRFAFKVGFVPFLVYHCILDRHMH